MANITTWPSQPLDGDQWERNTWDIGTPITKEKLENLEEGIAVLATQMEALLREVEIEPSTIILNGTRLDTIQKWLTAAENGNYSDFNTKGSILNRLNSIESVDTIQTNEIETLKTRATNLEAKATSLATEVWGSDTTSGTSRIDKNDNKIAALANELGGGTPDGTSAIYPTAATRLDDLEKEIGGTRNAGNGYTNSRIDNIQTWITGSNTGSYNSETIVTRLNDLQTWIAGEPTAQYDGEPLHSRLEEIELLNGEQQSRIEILEERTTATEEKNTSQDDRLQNLENSRTTNEARLDSLEASRTSDETRLDSLEEFRMQSEGALSELEFNNDFNAARIVNIIYEIGGTYSEGEGFSNSRISKIPSIMEKNDIQDSNINKIKVEVWGENKDYSDISRIDELGERTSIVESLSSSNQSRINSAESRIARIEGGAVAAKILNYATTNNTDSDSLILPTDSIIDKNSIAMIFLNMNTLGLNDITIQDGTATYNVKVNNNTNLRAHFSAGSLLGLYRGDTNDIYMFNAPLAI